LTGFSYSWVDVNSASENKTKAAINRLKSTASNITANPSQYALLPKKNNSRRSAKWKLIDAIYKANPQITNANLRIAGRAGAVIVGQYLREAAYKRANPISERMLGVATINSDSQIESDSSVPIPMYSE